MVRALCLLLCKSLIPSWTLTFFVVVVVEFLGK